LILKNRDSCQPWHVDPHLVHECLSRSHSPPQMTARSVHALPTQLHNKGLTGYNGTPKVHP